MLLQRRKPSERTDGLVFVSYAREDIEFANRLYERLSLEGLHPWMDRKDILPGQSWKDAITGAINGSAFFIALVSSRSVSKRGFVQKELRIALDVMEQMPPSDIFLIPVRLDDCEIPYPAINNIQWVDAFPSYEEGVSKLLLTLSPDRRKVKQDSTRYPNAIFELSFLDDSRHLLSLSQSGVVQLWDGITGKLVRNVAEDIQSLVVSPKDDLLIGIAQENAIQLIRLASGDNFGTLKTKHDVLSLAYSRATRQIVAGCADGSLSLWDMGGERGQFIGGFVGKQYGRSEGVSKVAFSPDGQHIVSLSSVGNRVKLWNVETHEMIVELSGRDQINDMVMSLDGRHVIWVDVEDDVFYYSTIRIYDVLKRKETAEWYEGYRVDSVAVSADGGRIAIASWKDQAIAVWTIHDAPDSHLYTNRQVRILLGHRIPAIKVAFAPDGSRIASSDPDGTIKVWDSVQDSCVTFDAR